MKERGGSLVGREWLFDTVHEFLAGGPGTLLVRGEPGTGKTAVAARLALASAGHLAINVAPVAKGTLSAAVFCRAGRVELVDLARDISGQLATSVIGFAEELRAALAPEISVSDVRVETGAVSEGATVGGVFIQLDKFEGERAFARGVSVPLKALRDRGQTRPVVLLVDAVEEAGHGASASGLSRMLARLEGVHLIVTCRSDPRVLADFLAASHQVDLGKDGPPGHDDLREYVGRRLDECGASPAMPVLIERIAGAADGNFLYAFYMTEALMAGEALTTMDTRTARLIEMPTGGLSGVYRNFLRRELTADENAWPERFRPILAPFAVALGDGLTVAQAAAVATHLAGRQFSLSDARDVIRSAGQFLEGPRPDGPFHFYHQSFARFLLDGADNPDWPIDGPEAEEAIVDVLSDTVPRDNRLDAKAWDRADSYVKQHIATHAAAAGRLDELLDDARFVLAAEPKGLLRVIDAAKSAETRMAMRAYRQVSHALTSVSPAERASYLEMGARELGAISVADAIAAAEPHRPWRTRWARWRDLPSYRVGTHGHGVYAVALSELDQRPVIVSAGGDGTVRVWDLADGSPHGEPLRHADEVRCVAIGKLDGRPVIVSGSRDRTVRVWDLAECAPHGEPMRHPKEVRCVTIAELNGQPVIISGAEDETLRVWDLAKGTPEGHAIDTPFNPGSLAAGQLEGRPILVCGLDNGSVWTWDLTDGSPRAAPPAGDHHVVAVTAGEIDGTPVIASGGDNGTVRVWNLADGTLRGEPIMCHRGWISSLTLWELEGTMVVVSGGGDDWTTGVRDANDGTSRCKPLRHTSAVWAVAGAALANEPVVVTGSKDGTVRVWELSPDTALSQPEAEDQSGARVVAVGDGRKAIAFGGWDRAVHVCDLVDGAPRCPPLTGHNGPVHALAVAELEGQRMLVSGGEDGTVQVWNADQGLLHGKPLTDHLGPVWAVAVAKLDGRPMVIAGAKNGDLRVWDMKDGTPQRGPAGGHPRGVYALAAGELNGEPIIISSGADMKMRIWDLATGDMREPAVLLDTFVLALATCDFEGQPRFVTGDGAGTVQVWDAASHILRCAFGHHQGAVADVAFGELDSRPVVFSGGQDGTLRVWELTGVARPEVISSGTEGTRHDVIKVVATKARLTIDLGAEISAVAAATAGSVVVGAHAGLMVLELSSASTIADAAPR